MNNIQILMELRDILKSNDITIETEGIDGSLMLSLFSKEHVKELVLSESKPDIFVNGADVLQQCAKLLDFQTIGWGYALACLLNQAKCHFIGFENDSWFPLALCFEDRPERIDLNSGLGKGESLTRQHLEQLIEDLSE